MDMRLSVIIPAAGSSSRMNSAVSKQLLKINGIQVLAHTMTAFEGLSIVSEIIIVCRDEEKAAFSQLAEQYGITKLKCFVSGGATRQQSVFNAVRAVSDDCNYIAVHDGARPLVSEALITKTAECAEKYGAAAPGTAVKDTIKLLDGSGFIAETPNRERLVSIQTPQIFLKDKYINAMNKAIESGCEYTDDCALLEAVGETVYVSKGSYANIKITTPEDILIAEILMEAKE